MSLAAQRMLVFSRVMHDEIKLSREVTAVQIPSGDSMTLPAGTPVFIAQRLGGTYTVATTQGLARISSLRLSDSRTRRLRNKSGRN